jgi:hypothetical protein
MEVAEGFLCTGWALKWEKNSILIAHIYITRGFHDNEYSYLFYWTATPNNLIQEYKRLEDHAVSIQRAASSFSMLPYLTASPISLLHNVSHLHYGCSTSLQNDRTRLTGYTVSI